jgi:hypothetical protein
MTVAATYVITACPGGSAGPDRIGEPGTQAAVRSRIRRWVRADLPVNPHPDVYALPHRRRHRAVSLEYLLAAPRAGRHRWQRRPEHDVHVIDARESFGSEGDRARHVGVESPDRDMGVPERFEQAGGQAVAECRGQQRGRGRGGRTADGIWLVRQERRAVPPAAFGRLRLEQVTVQMPEVDTKLTLALPAHVHPRPFPGARRYASLEAAQMPVLDA